jgi:hypothetical protein
MRQLSKIACASASSSRATSAGIERSSQAKNAASRIAPYLTTSASPAASSRAGSVARHAVSITTPRLVERADHVLAERMVDRRLAADRRVHLREQRRRHLQVRDAALVDRGREAGEVADDAAAERDQHGAAIGAQLQEPRHEVAQRVEALVRLAVGESPRRPRRRPRSRARRAATRGGGAATTALVTTTAREARSGSIAPACASAPRPIAIG